MSIKINMKDIPQKGKSPIFSYCRKLIKDGVDPNESLEIYRNSEDWDVRIPNIGVSAKYTVVECMGLGPRFVKFDPRDLGSRMKKYAK